ncbi:hypothetical protein [Microbispora siamensis]|uniref:DUF1876 domain-containing protein n=1 Tax=Microbispora siamensis TaxID=564413 RepID=A0ABQ4GLA7_9ACTN|nr:hypothetical protein [Microbispora siamensis]GIH62216.1 hypothetical protein Msi02_30330 [Microbispora siamensis]
MAHGPYTHVSMSINPGQRPRIGISFYASLTRARARVLESGRPYLVLESDEADVTVSTTGAGPVTPEDLEVARQIFNAAARYLADSERLHAEHAQARDSAA